MALRRDAGHALVELAHRVYETFPERAGERSVWTIGRIALDPGVQSIVPGRAEMHLQFRDEDEAILDRLEEHARALVAESNARGRAEACMTEVGKRSIPAMMDERLRGHIERAAEHHAPGDWVSMPSAAIHDAQVLARHMPAAMMFVPSIGGVSHAFEEDTSEEDIVAWRPGVRDRGREHAPRLSGDTVAPAFTTGKRCDEPRGTAMKFYTAQETIRLTLSQAIVKHLQAQYSERDGVERRFIQGVWGILGHGNVSGLSQALVEYGRDLPFHQPANEQSMVHAVSGFARANRRLATMACTSSIGPGTTNMLTGATTATICRLPVLLLPSDYYASRYQGQVLQDIEHPVSMDMSVTDCFRVVSRFFDRITRPEQILFSLPEAMRILTDPGETGAVTIALPQDIQGYAFDYPANFFDRKVWRVERRRPDAQRIAEAVALLKAARRPYIIAGGGVHYSEAWDELATFAETFGIPVGETHAGRGAIRNDSPMLVGGTGHLGTQPAAHFAETADLVICVGTRLADFVTGSNSAFQHPDVRFVSINVGAHDAHKIGAMPILADARDALRALTREAGAAEVRPAPEYGGEVATRKGAWGELLRTEVFRERSNERMSQGHLIGIINDSMQDGDTLVAAAGTIPADLTKLFDASGGRNLHLEFGNSCMGYDIPAAIGVRMAQEGGEVLILMGDGNYQMHPMELVTAMQERTKVTVLLNVNHGFQSIHGHQKALVGHSLGNEFRIRDPRTGRLDDGPFVEIDYVKNAESIGLRAWLANTEQEIREALAAARRETASCMIVVETEKYRFTPDSGVWWEVVGAEVTGDPKTRELVEAREAGRARQRFYN